MANKIRDYTKLAADICAAVGKDNILSATHCATRLRLVLRETPSDEVTKQISEMPAVIKVMESGGQYQVVIGTHAKDVYEALAQLLDLDNSTAAAPEVKQGPRQPHHRHHVRRVRTLCVHSGRSRSGARRTDHHYPLLPPLLRPPVRIPCSASSAGRLHLPAGHDRRHCFQALQV